MNSFCGWQWLDTEDVHAIVHCIKPGEMAAISAETAMLLSGNEDDLDRSDSFASDEDLEDGKTVIDNITS